jgi:hypothetical protein
VAGIILYGGVETVITLRTNANQLSRAFSLYKSNGPEEKRDCDGVGINKEREYPKR